MLAIIVDHPRRDLPSIVKLSEHLILHTNINQIVLVPSYYIDQFLLSNLFKSEVKVVIFNHFRINFCNRIKYSSAYGKRNIVYDSEGCPGPNGLWLEKVFQKSLNYFKYIDHYLFWGKAQEENIRKKFDIPFKTSVVGYLRIHEKKILDNGIKSILINTNFAYARPKFNLISKEKDEIQKLGFIDENEAKNKFKSSLIRRKNFIEAIDSLVKLNPNKNFILRIHPFEDNEDYNELVKKYENINFDTSKTSIKALLKSNLLIHIDCTTAIEAQFLNIPTLSLNWLIDDKVDIFSLASEIGFKAKNLKEANKFLNNIEIQKLSIRYNNSNSDKIRKFFGNNDSNSLSRISECILEELESYNNNKKKFKFNLDIKTYIKVFLHKILPKTFYDKLTKIYLGEKIFTSRKTKEFSEHDIFEEISQKVILRKKENFFYILYSK